MSCAPPLSCQASLDVFDYAFKPGEAVIDVVPGKAITGMARPESAEGLRRIMLIERHAAVCRCRPRRRR